MTKEGIKYSILLVTGFVLILALLIPSGSHSADLTLTNAPTQVYFSPGAASTEAILKEIMKAKSEILLQAQSLGSAPIAKALVDAHNRGVKVEVILGRSRKNDGCGSAAFFSGLKIPVCIDSKHATGHNTIIVIDGTTTITGSFDLGKRPVEKTADSLTFTKSKDLAKLYIDNWSKHREHAAVYEKKSVPKGKS
ncbi:MAG: Phospholipase D precursor [Syntrophorhabdus sp. PtaU1.Bin050]|jgi:phosphatidylserine/phosphatidylglycerophosphate/cardiolipin synthase-like enzyme|nr:MAG: Phospholipase D precursor [Syntrophorhabdus sp. PtaU1.Bin050]